MFKIFDFLEKQITTIWFIFLVSILIIIYHFLFGTILVHLFDLSLIIALFAMPIFIFRFPRDKETKFRNRMFYSPMKYAMLSSFLFLSLFNSSAIFYILDTELSKYAYSFLHLSISFGMLLYIIVYHNLSSINIKKEFDLRDTEFKSIMDD